MPTLKELNKLKAAAKRAINKSDDAPFDLALEAKANAKIALYNDYAEKI
jgi:hypothetical protein